MDKGNTNTRLIIYLILFLLFLGLSIFGYSLYNKGYGEKGRIKKELTPIVDAFNNLNSVKNNENIIKAKYSDSMIKITYIKEKEKYEYKLTLNETTNMKLIEMQYEYSDNVNGEYIASLVLDAVSVLNSNKENELFKKIKYSDLYNISTTNGANLSRRNNIMYLVINIDSNLLQNVKDLNLTNIEVKYITVNDIGDVSEVLNKNNSYNYYKNTITLDIRIDDNNYNIYCSNQVNNYDDIYESIMSVASILFPNVYDDIIISNYDYKSDLKKDNYKIEINPEIDRTTILTQDQYLMKLTINK
ncbi:MAG: hypothetical protein ACI33S_00390 [Bacilli bacterium]